MHLVSTADIRPVHYGSWPAQGAKAACMLLSPCAVLFMPAYMKVIHSGLLGAGQSSVALQSCPHTPKTASSKQGHPHSNLSCFSIVIKPKLISLAELYLILGHSISEVCLTPWDPVLQTDEGITHRTITCSSAASLQI